MMQEQQSSASGALLGELIKIIRQEAAPGGSAMTFAAEKTFTLESIGIPDTTLAREITQFVRDTEPGLLFHHSSRVYYWGANAARDFLSSHGIGQDDIDTVWTAIALHTTPGIPQHMHPVVALVTAGVEMDVLGLTYAEY